MGAEQRKRFVTVRRVQVLLFGLIAAGIVAYIVWGYSLGPRFEEAVAELHDRGVPEWSEFASPPPADEPNGIQHIEEALEILRRAEYAMYDREAGTGRLDLWPESEPVSEEDRRIWKEALPDLEPCFARIAAAARLPLRPPVEDGSAFLGAHYDSAFRIAHLLDARARHEPSTRAAQVDLLFLFADKLNERPGTHNMSSLIYRSDALKLLLEAARVPSSRSKLPLARLREYVERWAPEEEIQGHVRFWSAFWVRYFREARHGRDAGDGVIYSLGGIRMVHGGDEARGSWWSMPWAAATSTYARPMMLNTAVDCLRALRDRLDRPIRTADLRAQPTVIPMADIHLRMLGQRRLAILALLILEHERKHGDLPADLTRLGIDAASDEFLDPFTDSPAGFAHTKAGLTIWHEGPDDWRSLDPETRKETQEDRCLRWTFLR